MRTARHQPRLTTQVLHARGAYALAQCPTAQLYAFEKLKFAADQPRMCNPLQHRRRSSSKEESAPPLTSMATCWILRPSPCPSIASHLGGHQEKASQTHPSTTSVEVYVAISWAPIGAIAIIPGPNVLMQGTCNLFIFTYCRGAIACSFLVVKVLMPLIFCSMGFRRLRQTPTSATASTPQRHSPRPWHRTRSCRRSFQHAFSAMHGTMAKPRMNDQKPARMRGQ